MDSLPNELILIIFGYIQKITDKRQFLRTCKRYNNITRTLIKNIELEFIVKNYEKINHYCVELEHNIFNSEKIKTYCVERFTLELCHDSYFNLMPSSYFGLNNRILVLCLAVYNNLKLLQIAIDIGHEVIENMCEVAATYGHLGVLEFARNHNCIWGYTFSRAAENGHLHILKWAKKNGCDWDHITCCSAAANGQLEVLKWVKNHGCPWDEYTCAFAAQDGHLECLKWARENGCPWDEDLYIRAGQNKQWACLNWARKNDYDCDKHYIQELIQHGITPYEDR